MVPVKHKWTAWTIISKGKRGNWYNCKQLTLWERNMSLLQGKSHSKMFSQCLPNNFAVVKQRILGLRKKFVSNLQIHKEYSSYLIGVIDRGFAEPVPQRQLQLQWKSGKVWYIRHHSVYHPRKDSLCMVFDCGATFQGTSLNSNLLQGPDLTGSLLRVLTWFRR